jgi:allophanate hydrolase
VVEEVRRRIHASGEDAVWISLVPESQLMDAADRATAHMAEGNRLTSASSVEPPLLGIPFAVKDNFDVADQLTTAACPAFAYRAERTSTAVAKLQEAGAILIGKTNMDQFATGLVGTRSPYGTPRNPFDARYIPGGSSSGSAVAVSAGLVSFALGTDTAGSGRVPAAFNNIVGLKPTRGRISMAGVVPACRSLDCASIFALNCFDAARVLNVASGHDAADNYSLRQEQIPRRLPSFGDAFCFGIPCAAHLRSKASEETQAVFSSAVRRLRDLGGTDVEIDYEPFAKAGELLYNGPWIAERLESTRKMLATRPEALLGVIREILAGAGRLDAFSAFEGMHELKRLCRAADEQWGLMDVLLVPTSPTIYTREQVEAEPGRLNATLGYFTTFVNLMNLSAVAVPAGFGSNRLPVGVSLIAPPGNDATLLHLGDRLHRAAGVPMGATDAPIPPTVEIPAAPSDAVRLAVVGAHLSGQPLNHQLVNLKARLVRTCRTTPFYALYALAGTNPPKPGLIRCDSGRGDAIEVEVWEMTAEAFGRFVAAIPPPLGIGTLHLEDGGQVKGFLCESFAIAGATDITRFGGWRAFLKNSSP